MAMNAALQQQILHIAADYLALVALTLAFYVFFLNVRQDVNRFVGSFIALIAMSSLGLALALRAVNPQAATEPYWMMVAFTPTIGPATLTASLLVLKPQFLTGRRRWLLYVLLGLISLSMILAIVDRYVGTQLLYLGYDPNSYTWAGIPLSEQLNGRLGWFILWVNVYLLPAFNLLPLAYFAFRDRSISTPTRRLAVFFLVIQLAVVILRFGFERSLSTTVTMLITNGLFVTGYAYAAFRQMITERRLQAGNLRLRLTLLGVVITVPTLIFITSITATQARQVIIRNANQSLEAANQSLSTLMEQWLALNRNALETLVSLPGIRSMNAPEQTPILEAMAASYPHMYLISTTNIVGLNTARSDGKAPLDYSDREWFQSARSGNPLTYQVLVGRTSLQPALVVSSPIRNENGVVVGVGMFASELDVIAQAIEAGRVGETGISYIVDRQNRLVAHPSLAGGEVSLDDYLEAPPVRALRGGLTGLYDFTDANGVRWRAYIRRLDNDWGVIVQQQESELLSQAQGFWGAAWASAFLGVLLLVTLTWATMRQALQPIQSLTQTANEIVQGNLSSVVPVETEDEFGVLARVFNTMTAQLRDSISNLEKRVFERTRALERRNIQLQTAAEVGQAIAALHDLDSLLSQVTQLISDRFGFYHVGVFLLDEAGDFAVLRAANSPGGQRMLARRHQLRVGQQGIVGYVTGQREPRVELNVGAGTIHFKNPDLPETQAEMALPLIVGGELLGALDVQSTQVGAFSEQDVETMKVLADQVAIAVSNARLVQRAQELLEAERRAYSQITRRAWGDTLRSLPQPGIRRDRDGLHSLAPEDLRFTRLEAAEDPHSADPRLLRLEIRARDQRIGVLQARKPQTAAPWSPEEIELLEGISEPLSTALESARTYMQNRRRAEMEQLTGRITARFRETLDVETVLKTAAQEVRQALGLPEVSIHLSAASESEPGNGKTRRPS